MKKIVLSILVLFILMLGNDLAIAATTFTKTVSATELTTTIGGWRTIEQLDSDDYLYCYVKTSDYKGYYKVLRWSGSSFSEVVSETSLNNANTEIFDICKIDSDDFAVMYRNNGDSSKGYYKVLRWDGSTISEQVGATKFKDANTIGGVICQADSDDFVFFYNTYYIVYRWSGTAFSSVVTETSSGLSTGDLNCDGAFVSSGIVLVVSRVSSTSIKYIVYGWNGSSLSVTTAATEFISGKDCRYNKILYFAGKVLMYYQIGGGTDRYYRVVDYNNSMADVIAEVKIETAYLDYLNLCKMQNNDVLLLFRSYSPSENPKYEIWNFKDGYGHKIYGVTPVKINGSVPVKINGI